MRNFVGSTKTEDIERARAPLVKMGLVGVKTMFSSEIPNAESEFLTRPQMSRGYGTSPKMIQKVEILLADLIFCSYEVMGASQKTFHKRLMHMASH